MKTLLECGFSGWPGLLRFAVFRISKAFLIEFITPSSGLLLPSMGGFSLVPEPRSWGQFSRPPIPTTMLQGVHAGPPSLYLWGIWSDHRGLGRPDCERIDARVQRMKTEQAKMWTSIQCSAAA